MASTGSFQSAPSCSEASRIPRNKYTHNGGIFSHPVPVEFAQDDHIQAHTPCIPAKFPLAFFRCLLHSVPLPTWTSTGRIRSTQRQDSHRLPSSISTMSPPRPTIPRRALVTARPLLSHGKSSPHAVLHPQLLTSHRLPIHVRHRRRVDVDTSSRVCVSSSRI